ncbi:hypothetical protein [Thauera linaloolentis]|nr:hypothetical protein [Thauera linaloolentis]MCM8564474.1 hypothetical protein [Thauera linaloolentis]
MGLTAPILSATWGSANPAFDPAALRLTPSGAAQAPFFGILEFLDSGAAFRDAAGAPIIGPVGVFRLHPQAVQRLGALAQGRYALPGQPHHRILPEALVFTLAGPAPDQSPQTYDPGDSLGRTEPMSFHDHRGLIVDPIAVAALFDDLMTAFPALDAASGANRSGGGGVAAIAGLASGIQVQVTDLHGKPYVAVEGGPGVEKRNGDTATGSPDANGLMVPAAGEVLAGAGETAPARLRLGWYTGGTMAAGPLALPQLPAAITLPRQFLRAFATDLDWHILGNRSTGVQRGVPAEDGKMPADLRPKVRDGVTIDYLADGPDLLAESGRIIGRLAGADGSPLVFAVAPQIAAGVGVPPATSAAGHWPAFPGLDTATGLPAGSITPLTGATAAWTSGVDVLVTLPADSLPNGTSVRIYAQRFQLIDSIGEAPSFLRGDGGSAIVAAGQATQILVANPLGIAATDPKPSPAVLVFDLAVTPRRGARRLFANRRLDIAAGPAALPADPFATPDPMAMVPPSMQSICPAPLFGMTRTVSPATGLSNPIDIVRALGSESEPREGPRHPTMGRLESIVVSGVGSPQLDTGLDWDGVLSGAHWTRATRSALLRDGNPGNPAGPDTHLSAVRATGALGYDLARHAIRRAQSLLPLPGGTGATSLGWVAMSGGDNMNPPAPNSANPPAAGSSAGALLQSVAAIAETPELSLLPAGNPLDTGTAISFGQVIDDIAAALGLPPVSGSIDVANQDRLINEIRREYFLSRDGSRDALWSLVRAIAEAEELVYLETAGLSRTARPDGVPATGEIDLISLLAQRLTVRPNLKVIIAMPREGDFAPAPFARRAFAQRKEAYDLLAGAAPGRVVAFHPRGFPGRAAQLRGATAIVDDVWSLTGATHIRRRGMTFDGSAAIASFDRDIAAGYSRKVQAQRIALMAARLGVQQLNADGAPTPEFLRLARPASAFALIRDLLAQGGAGLIQPLWHGPQDTTVILQSNDVADPDGSNGAVAGVGLAAFLSEA